MPAARVARQGRQRTTTPLPLVWLPARIPDKFGRPVYIELLGRTDATALFETITTERLIRYHIWTWERYLRRYLPACSTAAGRTICTTTVIIDLAGLSLAHFNTATQKLLNTFSKIDQVRWARCARLASLPMRQAA